MVDAQLSTRLEDSIQKAFRSYTAEFKKKAKDDKKRYIDLIEKSMKEIIKDENVVLAKSSSQPQSIYEAAASLTEFELKKILLDKMQKVNRIRGALEHKELYDGVVRSYKLEKDLYESYGKAYSIKKDREDKEKDEDPPAGSDQGLKRRKVIKDDEPPKGSKSKDFKSSSSKDTKSQPKSSGNTDDQPNVEATSKHDWFKKLKRPPTPDPDWNARKFIDNLTQEHLVGPTFNLLKGTCRSRVELEYHFEECYKVVTDRLDWNNLEGHEYPFDLSKPLLLIEDRGPQVVLVAYFFNNDLEYLKGGSSSRKYTTYTTKTKATKYDDIQGIEDMVPSVSKHDVFSTKRIIAVTHVKVMKWYDYGYLEEIEVRKEEKKLYKFMEGDFLRLNLRDIEDMMLLLVQKKISNLERDVIFDLNVAFVLYDIASNPRIDYLLKKRWSNLDRKRSRIMIKAIDQQLIKRRLMRNLEKFVGGRAYEEEFRLLERTI
ncbi:hypothetical protein Tco_1284334 [Tanacetum coccineum]